MQTLLAQQVNWQENAQQAGEGAANMVDGGWDLVMDMIDTETGAIVFGIIVLLLMFRAVRRRVG